MKRFLWCIIFVSLYMFGMNQNFPLMLQKSSIDFNTDILDVSFNGKSNILVVNLLNKNIALVSFDEDHYDINFIEDSGLERELITWSPKGTSFACVCWVNTEYGVHLWAKNAHEHCYSKKFSYLVPDNTFIIKDIAWDYNSRFLAINLQYKSPDSHNETNKIIIIKYDGSWKKELSETRSIKNFAWHQKDNILAYVHECTVYGANVFSGESQKIVTFPEEIKKIAWNHDGKKLAIGISVEDGDSSIYIMKSHMNDPKKSYISCEFKRNSKLLNFVWGPNEIIAASYFDGFVVFYDTKKRKEVATIRTSFWLPYYLSWNKDGRLFAIAGFGGLDLEKVFIIKDFFGPSIHSCKEITEKIQS